MAENKKKNSDDDFMSLLDEVMKVNEDPHFFPEDLDLPQEESSPIPDIDYTNLSIEAMLPGVKELMEKADAFRLSDRAKQILQEFVTFRAQTQMAFRTLPEAQQTHYNLLIRAEDTFQAMDLTKALRNALHIAPHRCRMKKEKDMLDAYDEQHSPRFRGTPSPVITPNTDMLLIYDCQEAPIVDSDSPTGALLDASRRKRENYFNMWNEIFQHIKNNPKVILLVHANSGVYMGGLRHNSTLFYRVCGHHIFMPPITVDELLQQCVTRLEGSSFTISEDFVPALSDYFHTVYPRAELRGPAFVEDLIRRIYSLFFSSKRSLPELTPDCIPRYSPATPTPEDILESLDELVGLNSVKKEFRNIYLMQLAGLNGNVKPRYHMLFAGNPGTGKTTVAQMVADLLQQMHVIKTNKLLVVKPSDLMSQWNGVTSSKTADVINRAYDGVLFIDEAYGLAHNDRGRDVLNYLIQEMERNAHRLVVIMAGYKQDMQELLAVNPGLASRIGRQIDFEDYSLEELTEIFHRMCAKDGFSADPSVAHLLEDSITAMMTREYFGNARDIGNLLTSLKEAWSEEFYEVSQQAGPDDTPLPKVFLPRHFEKIMPQKKEVGIQDLVGLDTLKEKLEIFKKQVSFRKRLKEKGMNTFSGGFMHMIFAGNPGTGKTTVARSIADDLYAIGILKTNRLVCVERKDLVSHAVGYTAQKTAAVIKKAVGGVLFVDEAYSLAAGNSDPGREVIETFLTAMEEHKEDTIFIFAGYSDKMEDFLAVNPGIQSRIGYTFHFEDYTPQQLTKMFENKLTQSGFLVSQDALVKVEEVMEYFHRARNFGNGRFVDHVVAQTIGQRATRDFEQSYRDISAVDVPDIKTLIATAADGKQLYDPGTLTEEAKRRTALHELGHATVLCVLDPDEPPKSVSIKNQAGSYGRVTRNVKHGNATEDELLHHIAVLLAGKNAEKLFLGQHATGCSSDYANAKHVAQEMIRSVAMDTYGSTPKEILKAADELSMKTLQDHQEALLRCLDTLLEKQELSGEEFAKLLNGNP